MEEALIIEDEVPRSTGKYRAVFFCFVLFFSIFKRLLFIPLERGLQIIQENSVSYSEGILLKDF